MKKKIALVALLLNRALQLLVLLQWKNLRSPLENLNLARLSFCFYLWFLKKSFLWCYSNHFLMILINIIKFNLIFFCHFFTLKIRNLMTNCLVLKLLSNWFDLWVFRPKGEVMKYDRSCNSHIKGSCVLSILRNIYKSITNWSMGRMDTLTLVSKQKSGGSTKRMFCDVFRLWGDFHAENFNSIFITVISYLLKRVKN